MEHTTYGQGASGRRTTGCSGRRRQIGAPPLIRVFDRHPTMTELTRAAEYRAVDLDIRSRRSLAPLLKAWPWAQTPARKANAAPRWLVVRPQSIPTTPDQAVEDLVRMVEKLPRDARRCWNEASARVFDIGVQAGLSPSIFEGVRLSEN